MKAKLFEDYKRLSVRQKLLLLYVSASLFLLLGLCEVSMLMTLILSANFAFAVYKCDKSLKGFKIEE